MKQILVVDDDPMVCQMCGRILRLAGYSSVTVLSGIRCMSYIRDDKNPTPDMIILDVEMPGMDGLKTLAAIRLNENLAHIPVMFLTSLCTPETVAQAIALGVNEYIKKPFTGDDLVKRVKKLLGE